MIALLKEERDYYRAITLGLRSLPSVETALSPSLPVPLPQGGFGSEWSDDEWADYNNWCALQVNMGMYGEPEFYRKLYREQFGDQSPSDVMREG